MNVMRELWYWSGSKNGPKVFAIILLDGTAVDVDTSDHFWSVKIQSVPLTQAIGLLTAGESWHYKIDGAEHPIYSKSFDVFATRDEALSAALAARESSIQEQKALESDPVAHLESELSRYDWTAWASDDGSVWQAWQHRWDTVILPLKAKVGDQKFDELCQKHNPYRT